MHSEDRLDGVQVDSHRLCADWLGLTWTSSTTAVVVSCLLALCRGSSFLHGQSFLQLVWNSSSRNIGTECLRPSCCPNGQTPCLDDVFSYCMLCTGLPDSNGLWLGLQKIDEEDVYKDRPTTLLRTLPCASVKDMTSSSIPGLNGQDWCQVALWKKMLQSYWTNSKETVIDWCYFYYSIRNSLVALLEALFARNNRHTTRRIAPRRSHFTAPTLLHGVHEASV